MGNKLTASLLTTFVLLAVGVFAYSGIGILGGEKITSQGVEYNGYVCTQVIRVDGTVEDNGCSHNVLYLSGANLTRDLLTTDGDGSLLNNISLCNSTTPSDGCGDPISAGTETFTDFDGCGLNSATDATISNIGSENANWTVYKTFTSTCDAMSTNVTRLSNDSALFAGNTFTEVTLQTNDQLTINWTISVT